MKMVDEGTIATIIKDRSHQLEHESNPKIIFRFWNLLSQSFPLFHLPRPTHQTELLQMTSLFLDSTYLIPRFRLIVIHVVSTGAPISANLQTPNHNSHFATTFLYPGTAVNWQSVHERTVNLRRERG